MIERDLGDHPKGEFFLVETKDIERGAFAIIVFHPDYVPAESLNQKDYDLVLKGMGSLAQDMFFPAILQRLYFQGKRIGVIKHEDDIWTTGPFATQEKNGTP